MPLCGFHIMDSSREGPYKLIYIFLMLVFDNLIAVSYMQFAQICNDKKKKERISKKKETKGKVDQLEF